ncbi:RNase A-like domain-containing protein [Actinomadura gamaensis]|uniref:RNase A-like domain-containing protein n=1 Tax=Actinomadura gamaensis TaxID=1763541 RepID=A0ABV9U7M2_9ACTN
MRGASTFVDTPTAQRFVQAVVDANTVTIREWLARGHGERPRLDGYFPSEPTGRLMLRGMLYAGRGPVDAHGVHTVLEVSARLSNSLAAFATVRSALSRERRNAVAEDSRV